MSSKLRRHVKEGKEPLISDSEKGNVKKKSKKKDYGTTLDMHEDYLSQDEEDNASEKSSRQHQKKMHETKLCKEDSSEIKESENATDKTSTQHLNQKQEIVEEQDSSLPKDLENTTDTSSSQHLIQEQETTVQTSLCGHVTALLIVILGVAVVCSLGVGQWITMKHPFGIKESVLKLTIAAILFLGFIVVAFYHVCCCCKYNKIWNSLKEMSFVDICITITLVLLWCGITILHGTQFHANHKCKAEIDDDLDATADMCLSISVIFHTLLLVIFHICNCRATDCNYVILIYLIISTVWIGWDAQLHEAQEIFHDSKIPDNCASIGNNTDCFCKTTKAFEILDDMSDYLYAAQIEFCLLIEELLLRIFFIKGELKKDERNTKTSEHGESRQNEKLHRETSESKEKNEPNIETSESRQNEVPHRETRQCSCSCRCCSLICCSFTFYALLIVVACVTFQLCYAYGALASYYWYYIPRMLVWCCLVIVCVIPLCINFRGLKWVRNLKDLGAFKLAIIFSLVGYFLHTCFSFYASIATLSSGNHDEQIVSGLLFGDVLLNTIQIFLQTIFLTAKIIDSNCDGWFMGIISYILCSNVLIYVLDSAGEVTLYHKLTPVQMNYYGDSWVTITHITFPFTLFFRISSCILCLEIIQEYMHFKQENKARTNETANDMSSGEPDQNV